MTAISTPVDRIASHSMGALRWYHHDPAPALGDSSRQSPPKSRGLQPPMYFSASSITSSASTGWAAYNAPTRCFSVASSPTSPTRTSQASRGDRFTALLPNVWLLVSLRADMSAAWVTRGESSMTTGASDGSASRFATRRTRTISRSLTSASVGAGRTSSLQDTSRAPMPQTP